MTADQYTNANQSSKLVPDEIVRRVTQAHLDEAELSSLTSTLSNARASDLPETSIRELGERRAELIKATPLRGLKDAASMANLDRAVLGISDLLFPWHQLNLPYMYEGINEKPGGNTEGEIGTAGLFAGGLAFGGQPTDFSFPAGNEKWWIHNWRNSVVFPSAPSTGRLYYRFTVDSECHVYRAPVLSGSIREFVTIGWTADVASSPMDDWNSWNTVGWPVDILLPSDNLNLGGAVPVTGSIAVQQGKSAALGFIYGTVVSVASGYVMFLWGNFGTRLTYPPGGTVDYRAYDKIEYRFEPDWWVNAVAQRLEASL